MNLAIDNVGQQDLPIAVIDGDTPKVDEVNSGVTYYVRDDSTVVIVGHKPDLEEQLKTAGQVLIDTLRSIVARIAGNTTGGPQSLPEQTIAVSIENFGDNAVRVILGDGVSDTTVQPGATYMASAKGYVEIRELGHVPQSDDPAQQQGQTIA